MPSGNGARAAQRRERVAKQNASKSEAKSQLKLNEQMKNVICQVCRQTFMNTVREPELRLHHENKHAGVPINRCFPNLN